MTKLNTAASLLYFCRNNFPEFAVFTCPAILPLNERSSQLRRDVNCVAGLHRKTSGTAAAEATQRPRQRAPQLWRRSLIYVSAKCSPNVGKCWQNSQILKGSFSTNCESIGETASNHYFLAYFFTARARTTGLPIVRILNTESCRIKRRGWFLFFSNEKLRCKKWKILTTPSKT